jgi:hypothetical protein
MATTKNVVCYHYPCPDGIYAALAASVRLPHPCSFVPLTVWEKEEVRTQKLLELVDSNTDVYLCDFSGGPTFILAVARACRRLVIIDHHKTAQEDLSKLEGPPTNLEVNFDLARSGATLARDYFHLGDWLLQRPSIDIAFRLVEDNDLWRHALPDSRAFAAGFGVLALELSAITNPEIFEALMALDPAAVIASGNAELEKQRVAIDSDLEAASEYCIPGPGSTELRALAVVTRWPQYRSELGNRLASKSLASGLAPVGVVVYEEAGLGSEKATTWKVSLRSLDTYDTTPFSRLYGGGGHANASSFLMEKAVFDQWHVPSPVSAGTVLGSA